MAICAFLVLFLLNSFTITCGDKFDPSSVVWKCCPSGQQFVNKKCKNVGDDADANLVKTAKLPHSAHVTIRSNYCDVSSKILFVINEDEEECSVRWNNKLYYRQEFLDYFCVDYNADNGGLRVLVCEDKVSEYESSFTTFGMIISMPFLLLTFIAYALLPDRNLHMKALMFYVINLMFSYLLLVIIQLSESQFAEATCKSLGYFCLFFFLVSFFWMNVICIDIWWGFSGLRGFTGSKKTAERKRFLFYCAYAWGMPVLHVLVVFIIDILANQNSVLKPDIGNGQCFLRRGFPELLYFYGPMAILITINIVLFAITAIKIRRIKSETAMLKKEDSKRHSYENDRQIFNLYVKLLFAMGVNWSMEIISWAVIWAEEAPEAIWYLTDFCNAIYGVFIFFIFVFKRSIWKLLKKRYYTFIGKHHLAHSMTMTNTTRVTSYSTATSTIQETAHGGDNDTSTLKHDP
ncbi:G-protein coupled receptor Mth2 isoform X8 [Tribolium castaneum]|uniref:G-protein coupled receptor Mth2 isoform X8 n=1 Tax=Tribolium castaneum TaxID=7070 RepID=UPI00046C1E6C|nr:PREDICTED: G-protein coupled receptor Mth2 isoform X5 [Tribolium castaneum]|eukprot:XP_008191006.1 PREDICTED: G-protein coupled receptor Mth2 isoform X5 [Tribolium castaneum]